MVMITLYARQQKRHRCIEQSFRLWERARVGWFGRMVLKHVYYHMWNELPVQVWCMIQDARGWCTGMIQKDGMERGVGGGFSMGNTCTPVAYSGQCMAKSIQYFKVKKKKKKIHGTKSSEISTFLLSFISWSFTRFSQWTPEKNPLMLLESCMEK